MIPYIYFANNEGTGQKLMYVDVVLFCLLFFLKQIFCTSVYKIMPTKELHLFLIEMKINPRLVS